MPPAAMAASAQSFNEKIEHMEEARAQGQPVPEVRLSGQEVTAALAQAVGAMGMPAATSTPSASTPSASTSSNGPMSRELPGSGGDSSLSGELGPGEPNIKDYSVNFEGDQVVGQFLTQVAGKEVWVTVKGHLGSKDGYATFDPTEFKVGDLNVPVSLVNDQLQKRLAEQRDRLKLPDSVSNLKVENSEVVLSSK